MQMHVAPGVNLTTRAHTHASMCPILDVEGDQVIYISVCLWRVDQQNMRIGVAYECNLEYGVDNYDLDKQSFHRCASRQSIYSKNKWSTMELMSCVATDEIISWTILDICSL